MSEGRSQFVGDAAGWKPTSMLYACGACKRGLLCAIEDMNPWLLVVCACIQVEVTKERSKFVRDAAGWKFADTQVLEPAPAPQVGSLTEY